jgi:sulfur-oxidizing protein SoxB
MYDVPAFGNVSLLHFTDCHGQLVPGLYREPSVNLGFGASGQPPHLVGEALLKRFGIKPGTIDARLHVSRFHGRGEDLRQGRRLRPPRHAGQALEGVTGQALLARRRRHVAGSATALWTKGRTVDACKLLGVDMMTGTGISRWVRTA